jgi:hypothetical protein
MYPAMMISAGIVQILIAYVVNKKTVFMASIIG